MCNQGCEEINIHWYLPDAKQHKMDCFLKNINNIYEIAKAIYGNDVKIDIAKVEDGGKKTNILLFFSLAANICNVLGSQNSIENFVSNTSYKYYEVRNILTTFSDGCKNGAKKYNETQQKKIVNNKNEFYENDEAEKIVFFSGKEDEDVKKTTIFKHEYSKYIEQYEESEDKQVIIPLKKEITINQVRKTANNICMFTDKDLEEIKKNLDEDKKIEIKKENSYEEEVYFKGSMFKKEV